MNHTENKFCMRLITQTTVYFNCISLWVMKVVLITSWVLGSFLKSVFIICSIFKEYSGSSSAAMSTKCNLL